MNLVGARQLRSQLGNENRIKARGDNKGQCAASKCQQKTFGQQLPHYARLRSAKRAAAGKLAPTRSRARQQQVGNIRAGDQQDESYSSKQYQQRRVHISHQIVVQRDRINTVLFVVLGILTREAGGDSIEFRLRLLWRDVLLEA